MKTSDVSKYVMIGLREALFVLRTNILVIAGLSAFIFIYTPLTIYNLIHSQSLAMLPNEAKLQIVLPIASINNILVSLLISVMVSTSIERERVYQVLEYLVAYSTHTVGEFLLIKLLSATALGIVIAIPYAVVTSMLINMLVGMGPSILVWLIPSLIFSVVSFTLLMLLISLILELKYANMVRTLAIILIFLTMSYIAKGVQSKQGVLSLSAITLKLVGPLYVVSAVVLVLSIALYSLYRDRIVELSLR